MFVTGLLLAAESSPHLGVPRQLLAYHGETLLGDREMGPVARREARAGRRARALDRIRGRSSGS